MKSSRGSSPRLISVLASPWALSAFLHATAAVALVTVPVRRGTVPAPSSPQVDVGIEVAAVAPPPPEPSFVEPSRPPARSAPVPASQAIRAAQPSRVAPAPAVLVAPSASSGDPPPTFVMAISALTISASVVAAGAPVQRSSSGQVVSDAPLDERGVTAPATVVSQPVAKYPAAARAAEVERDVPVDIVVDARGEVIEARVEGHVGYGLDEAALETVRRTRFRPAQRDGQAVAVRMRWTMQFRLE